MNKYVLIVEDEKDIAEGLKISLEEEGFNADICFDGEQAVDFFSKADYDLIVCDIMMPNMNGFEVISEIRRVNQNIPILILSARVEDKDKIRALNLGADDYMTKPFNIQELVLRCKRKLSSQISSSNKSVFGQWSYDHKNRQLYDTKNKKYIDIASNDLDILDILISRKNEIISRDDIMKIIRKENHSGTDRIVDNSIVRLRKIFGKEIIKTLRGKGYRIIVD